MSKLLALSSYILFKTAATVQEMLRTHKKVFKAIIPAAGTRLLSATKEPPKEMLPLFASEGLGLCIKPAVQQIFEQLFGVGLREFCVVVRKGKRALEDHFAPDRGYVQRLNSEGKKVQLARGCK